MGVAVGEFKAQGGKKRDRLLRLLTYEVVDGRPIYYRGYRDVLEGKKHPEEVMGSSALQSKVLEMLLRFLFLRLPADKFRVATGEVGVITSEGNVRSLDIGVFPVSKVREYENLPHYYPVPPDVVIEVDVKAHLEDGDSATYILQKSRELLTFGVEKVVWILTSTESVFVFEKGKKPVIYDWEDEIHLLEDVKLRLSDILKRP